MAEQDYATVSETKVHKSDSAYAPAGSEPSEWKLPIHDASHVRNALARCGQTELPEAAKVAAKRKILERAHKYGTDTSRFEKEHGSTTSYSPPKLGGESRGGRLVPAESTGESGMFAHGIPVLLTGAGQIVDMPKGMAMKRPGAQLREIAVAVSGSWVKGDHSFSITKDDLDDMARNFDKRKNDMIVIDYEHASEMPEVAKGGPIPGAGWIHDLRATIPYSAHKLGATTGLLREIAPKQGGESGMVLTALVEWTPQAEEMLHSGQYRFFSPAIDWATTDKETGEPQGATLTSGALTNHPFLEELPPIMLSDGEVVEAVYDRLMNGARRALLQLREGEKSMKRLKLRPIPEGDENAGHHAVMDAETGESVGLIPHDDLTEYAANHLGMNPDVKQDVEESTGAADRSESQALSMEAHEARRRVYFLSEAVRKGKIDNQCATALAEAGKITLADYIQAQEAERLIESAITAGKILPRDRAFFFRDALDRPKEFFEFIRNTSPVVQWGAKGIGSAEFLPVDEEIDLGVKRLMSEKGLDYAKALKQFLNAHPGIGEQYRSKHTRPTPAETSAQ